jgi:hypothetical protein
MISKKRREGREGSEGVGEKVHREKEEAGAGKERRR